MISSRLVVHHAVNGRQMKDEKSGSSHQVFHKYEPFFHDGGYKTSKVIKFFKKRQVGEFNRVKTFLVLNLSNEKATYSFSIVFYVKDVNQYPNTNNQNPFFEKFHLLKKPLTKFKK